MLRIAPLLEVPLVYQVLHMVVLSMGVQVIYTQSYSLISLLFNLFLIWSQNTSLHGIPSTLWGGWENSSTFEQHNWLTSSLFDGICVSVMHSFDSCRVLGSQHNSLQDQETGYIVNTRIVCQFIQISHSTISHCPISAVHIAFSFHDDLSRNSV